eukprot:Sspe_Gene.45983::Locus_22867_Transcript_1_1_Confidence_1.000_Length_2921::g.45983::m.45983/K15436/TRPO3, MTR10; transportin-3
MASDVVAAVHVLHDPNSSGPQRKEASDWLEGFCKDPSAWRELHAVLSGGDLVEHTVVHFHAARMLREKAKRDISQLDGESQLALMKMVLGHILRFTASPSGYSVRVQLGLTLAAVAMQRELKLDTVAEVASALSSHPAALVELFHVLGEEAVRLGAAEEDTSRHHVRAVSIPLVASAKHNASSVVALLRNFLSAGSIDLPSALSCYAVWLPMVKFQSEEMVVSCPLIGGALNAVGAASPGKLLEATTEAVTQLGLVAVRDGNEVLAGHLSAQIPRISQMYQSCMNSNIEVAYSLARILSAVGTSFAGRLVEVGAMGQQDAKDFVHLLAQCTAHRDSSIGEATFGFWHALRLASLDADMATRQAVRSAFAPSYEVLFEAVLRFSELPDDVGEDEENHRADVIGPVLRDTANLIGVPAFMEHVVARIPSTSDWQKGEALLFSLAALHTLPGPEVWERVAPSIISCIGELQHPMLKITLATLLPRLSRFLDENPTTLLATVRLVADALSHCSTDTRRRDVSRAFLRLCTDCAKAFVHYREQSPLLPTLLQVFHANSSNPVVAEAVGVVLWSLPPSELPSAVQSLIAHLLDSGEASLRSGTPDTSCLAALASLLSAAAAWCETAVLDVGDRQTQSQAVASAWAAAWPRLWGLLKECLVRYSDHEPTAKEVCECLRGVIRVAGDGILPHIQEILQGVIQGCAASPRACYVQAIEGLICSFSHSDQLADPLAGVFATALDKISPALAPTPYAPAFADTELGGAVFHLIAAVTRRSVLSPGGGRVRNKVAFALFNSPAAASALSIVVSALTAPNTVDAPMLCCALAAADGLVTIGGSAFVGQADRGAEIIFAVATAVATKASECTVPAGNVLASLRQCSKDAVRCWATAAMGKLDTPEVTDEVRHVFVESLMDTSTPGSAAARSAVDKLHRAVNSAKAALSSYSG